MARDANSREAEFRVRFHAYVSKDPSVNGVGTSFPQPAPSGPLPDKSIGEILSAAAAAPRVNPEEIPWKSFNYRSFSALPLHFQKIQRSDCYPEPS